MPAESNQPEHWPTLAFLISQVPPCQWAGLMAAMGWYGFWTATHNMYPPSPKAVGGLTLGYVLGIAIFLVIPDGWGLTLNQKIGWSILGGMGGAPVYRAIAGRIIDFAKGAKAQ